MAPDSANRRATAIPMPLLPPVTTATRSFIDSCMLLSLLSLRTASKKFCRTDAA
ncbi:hypothetical protein QIH80_31010 [Bradyrhizobium elkanii]|nr:hypothetical protein QIH80_31010 [Bradyrhizobium elkanii]